MLFYSGEGVPKSMTEAGELLKRAALQFHPQAMHALGWLYSDGFEAPTSTKAMGFAIGLLIGGIHIGDGKIEAFKWFNLAATYGYAKAYTGMRQMAFCMSWSQINEARTRAMPLYPHYAVSTRRQVLTSVFRFWVEELRRGRKVLPYDTASALLSKFESVEELAIEALFLRLEAEFLGKGKPKRQGDRFYFKNAVSAKEAGWCLAEMMSWEKQNLDLYSPEFICAEQNALNQIWLMFYRGMRS
jgi:TPR repeat protein